MGIRTYKLYLLPYCKVTKNISKNAQSWLLIVLFFKEFPAIKRVYTEHYFCLPSVKPALPVALEA
nr:MAG TPA: hypothetical protein [Caudoviricetes sp.]